MNGQAETDLPYYTPEQLAALKKKIRVHYNPFPSQTIYHGTTTDQINLLKQGPKNIGGGFGGQGLYVAFDHDRALAAEYARIATQFSNSEPVVMEGILNFRQGLRVAKIEVSAFGRGGKVPDPLNGVFEANWSKHPQLSKLMENFDVIIVTGAMDNGLNLSSNCFAVVRESAGKDFIHWQQIHTDLKKFNTTNHLPSKVPQIKPRPPTVIALQHKIKLWDLRVSLAKPSDPIYVIKCRPMFTEGKRVPFHKIPNYAEILRLGSRVLPFLEFGVGFYQNYNSNNKAPFYNAVSNTSLEFAISHAELYAASALLGPIGGPAFTLGTNVLSHVAHQIITTAPPREEIIKNAIEIEKTLGLVAPNLGPQIIVGDYLLRLLAKLNLPNLVRILREDAYKSLNLTSQLVRNFGFKAPPLSLLSMEPSEPKPSEALSDFNVWTLLEDFESSAIPEEFWDPILATEPLLSDLERYRYKQDILAKMQDALDKATQEGALNLGEPTHLEAYNHIGNLIASLGPTAEANFSIFDEIPILQSADLTRLDRGFNLDSGVKKSPPKNNIFWEEMSFSLSATAGGPVIATMAVPVTFNSYAFNANLSLEIDGKIFEDLIGYISGDVEKHKEVIHTSHGDYIVKSHKLFKSLYRHGNWYEVTIKDSHGQKHSYEIQLTKGKQLGDEINHRMGKLLQKELSANYADFTQEFSQKLAAEDFKGCQNLLNAFVKKFAEQLPADFKQPFQTQINMGFASERVKQLANAPINEIVSKIEELSSANDQFVNQEIMRELLALKELLIQRLNSVSEPTIMSALNSLKETRLGQTVTSFEVEPKALAEKKQFKSDHKGHGRNEMRDSAQMCIDRIFSAYRKLDNALKSGSKEEIGKAIDEYITVYKNEKDNLWDIKMKGDSTAYHEFKRLYPNFTDDPEQLQCIVEYRNLQVNHDNTKILTDSEYLGLTIIVNMNLLQKSYDILQDETSSSEEKSEALESFRLANEALLKAAQDPQLQNDELAHELIELTTKNIAALKHKDFLQNIQELSLFINPAFNVLKRFIEEQKTSWLKTSAQLVLNLVQTTELVIPNFTTLSATGLYAATTGNSEMVGIICQELQDQFTKSYNDPLIWMQVGLEVVRWLPIDWVQEIREDFQSAISYLNTGISGLMTARTLLQGKWKSPLVGMTLFDGASYLTHSSLKARGAAIESVNIHRAENLARSMLQMVGAVTFFASTAPVAIAAGIFGTFCITYNASTLTAKKEAAAKSLANVISNIYYNLEKLNLSELWDQIGEYTYHVIEKCPSKEDLEATARLKQILFFRVPQEGWDGNNYVYINKRRYLLDSTPTWLVDNKKTTITDLSVIKDALFGTHDFETYLKNNKTYTVNITLGYETIVNLLKVFDGLVYNSEQPPITNVARIMHLLHRLEECYQAKKFTDILELTTIYNNADKETVNLGYQIPPHLAFQVVAYRLIAVINLDLTLFHEEYLRYTALIISSAPLYNTRAWNLWHKEQYVSGQKTLESLVEDFLKRCIFVANKTMSVAQKRSLLEQVTKRYPGCRSYTELLDATWLNLYNLASTNNTSNLRTLSMFDTIGEETELSLLQAAV